jgi:hypothetical protein
VAHPFECGAGIVRITEGAVSADYYVARQATPSGTYYHVAQFIVNDAGDLAVADPHFVRLDGVRSSCSCPSGCGRPGRLCLHVAALLALEHRGVLP